MTYQKGDVLQKEGEMDRHVEGMVGDIVIAWQQYDKDHTVTLAWHKNAYASWKKKSEGRWKPENGETYFCVVSFGVELLTWTNSMWDDTRYNHGNCFRTKEEAKEAAVKVNELLLSLHE